MSTAFNFGAGRIAIFTDNANENLASKKRMDETKLPAKKRTALGVITNNQRIQPSRAAKQGLIECTGNENIQPKHLGKTTCSSGFSIHCDESVTSCQPPQSTRLPCGPQSGHGHQARAPLTLLNAGSQDHDVIEIEDSPVRDSPMVLDQSMDYSRIQDETPEQRFDRLLSVPEYADEVYTYLRELEKKHRAKPSYMKRQPDITAVMRSVLVDWLVEVAEEYKLHRQTLALAVNYIDRFLSHMSVLRGKLQLVGAASMFLAAKFEEIYPPEVHEFVYITDDTYTKKQVLRMEHLILKVLSFDVAVPTFNCFADKFLRDMGADDKTKHLAMYLGELSLIDADMFLKYLPSQIAAASICLANLTLGATPWPRSLAAKTNYEVGEFEDCLTDLHRTYCQAAQLPQQAIQEKYKQDKFLQVALIPAPSSLASAASH